jgi:hypothetical protein
LSHTTFGCLKSDDKLATFCKTVTKEKSEIVNIVVIIEVVDLEKYRSIVDLVASSVIALDNGLDAFQLTILLNEDIFMSGAIGAVEILKMIEKAKLDFTPSNSGVDPASAIKRI